jgi:hypothetical protein
MSRRFSGVDTKSDAGILLSFEHKQFETACDPQAIPEFDNANGN